MVYLFIWLIPAFILIGILGYYANFEADPSWIFPISVFWPITLLVVIGIGIGWLFKNIIVPYLKHWFVK